ncbi:hypothetical protein WA577_006167 [Blastocystis sp. JDR]
MISEDYSRSDNIIKSFNWVLSCLSYLWNGFYNRFIDPFVWLFTGKTHVTRLLCTSDYSPKTTMTIQGMIMSESSFPETRSLLLRHEKYDVTYAMQLFYKEAGVRLGAPYFNATFRNNTSVCFHQLLGTNVVLQVVDDLKNTPYDRENEEHEALLLQLWSNLKPDEELIARETDQWGDIGFQGRDPATDFRGLGLLSLSNLCYYALHHTDEAIHCLLQSDVTRGGYPMAITGIQLSALINDWTAKRLLDRQFFSVDVENTDMSLEERALYFYQEFFCRVFTAFDAFYESKHPENLLQFPIILKEFEKSILRQIEEGIF